MANQSLITLQELHHFDHLSLMAKQVVEGFIIGLHKSPFHGFSVEFAEHRLYNPGESVRNVDWKVYGRTDRMYVKKFEEETNLRCQIVVDASSSMYYPENAGAKGEAPINKIRFAAVSAASLMYMLRMQRDAFGLSLFSDQLEQHTQARSTRIHYQLMLQYLQDRINEPHLNKPTQAADSLHLIADRLHRRSLVIIFSDMLDQAMTSGSSEKLDDLFSALQHLKYNKHEVILFHVVDKKHELDFAFDNRPYVFVDMETGEKVRLQSNQVKKQYLEHMQAFKKTLELRCAQYKIDFVEADIHQDFKQILQPYLVKRGKLY